MEKIGSLKQWIWLQSGDHLIKIMILEIGGIDVNLIWLEQRQTYDWHRSHTSALPLPMSDRTIEFYSVCCGMQVVYIDAETGVAVAWLSHSPFL